jgi:uncharacterized heparinase superfamily protein
MERQLRDRLEHLHAELAKTDAVDDASRELLADVLGDIQQLLDRSGEERPHEPQGLVDRLRDATRQFEESHPTLAAAVGRVMDTLSNMGI